MKRILTVMGLLAVIVAVEPCVFAGSLRLQYKLAPGQTWIEKYWHQSETSVEGTKRITRTKRITEYKVMKGPEKGWASLVARMKSYKAEDEKGTTDFPEFTLIEFRADMRSSGEMRNIRYTVNSAPKGSNTKDIPPERAATMRQTAMSLADQWKKAVFWFPALPAYSLKPGDDFEVSKKAADNDFLSKEVFSLEDVQSGLAYFTIKYRGTRTNLKSLGKGKAVFDVTEGMWVEFTTTYRHAIEFTMHGKRYTSEVLDTNKREIEKQ